MFKKAFKPIFEFSIAFFLVNSLIDYLFYWTPYFYTRWSGFALGVKSYLLGYLFAVVLIFRLKYRWQEGFDFFRIVVYCFVFLFLAHLLGAGYDYLFYNVLAPDAGVQYAKFALNHFHEFIQNVDPTLLQDSSMVRRSLEETLKKHEYYQAQGYPFSLLLMGRLKQGAIQGLVTSLPLGILLRDPIRPNLY